MNHNELESQIRKIGAEIYSAMGRGLPAIFDTRKWKGKIMEWAMKDEAFKIQLFRFIDVLPCLKTDELVLRILDEYFGEMENAPAIIKRGVKRIFRRGVVSHLAAGAVRAGVESVASQFIAGRELKDTLKVVEKLRKDGLAVSLDILGEEVLSDKEAAQYANKYLDLIKFLPLQVNSWPRIDLLDTDDKGSIPRLDISLKVSSFYSQLDPVDWEGAIENAINALNPIVEAAQQNGVSLTLDMEHYYLKDLTISIFKRILEENANFYFGGIVIQTYLKDSKRDLLDILNWAKRFEKAVLIRLVKGAYWDYENIVNRRNGWDVPVYTEKEETDQNFEDLTRLLLENINHVRPAIATHNIRSISNAIAVAEKLGLPRKAVEFQMIYGMAEPIREALRKMGFRVRAYTPVGELIPGMAYLIRRLLENTYNESFLRKAFFESTPFEKLIEEPLPRRIKTKPHSEKFQNEPLTDFSKASNREKMSYALHRMRNNFGKKYPLLIGGQEIWTDTKPSLNPAKPDEIVGEVCSATIAHVDQAVKIARTAWEKWRRLSPDIRADFLFRAAQEIRKRRFDLIALEIYEVGKTWKDADGDIAEAIDYLEYYGREAIRLGIPRFLGDYLGEQNAYLYEPRGVGAVISPWNFPIAIPTGMIAAGLVTGNCVIFKPSGLSPVCGWNIMEIFKTVGLPSDVLQFVPGAGGEVGEYLTSHPGVDFIAFTGSRDVGLRIVKLAGDTKPGQRNVKRVIAEMGGKNAIIVDETADLDEAVRGVVESALGFQGQKCSACSRVIVVGEIFDEFSRRLKDSMESIKIGPPDQPQNLMGPVIDEVASKRIDHYRKIAVKNGKVILMKETSGKGYFVGPVIVSEVATDSPLAQEEIFGPIVTLIRANNIDEALELANNTAYGLTGGIFSRSPANIRKAQREFDVGNLYINRKITGALVGRQPFGGFKMSGIGSKAGGPDYLLQFYHIKSISENTMRRGFAPKSHQHD